MSAALQHPMIGPYTIEDWLALEPTVDGSRLELIFGYLHLTPAPAGEHQNAAFLLAVSIREAIRAAKRAGDLYVVPAVNVEISTAWRTALIPDIVVMNRRPVGVSFPPEAVVLAVEIWSAGNKRAERETKTAGYAAAGIPFLWTLDQGNALRGPTLTAYRLEHDQYTAENTIQAGAPATITAAPLPVTLDPADLTPQ